MSFDINKRHLWGISAAGVLLALIVATNIFLRLSSITSPADFEFSAQHIQSVGKIAVISVGIMLGMLVLGGTAAFILGKKTIAMKLYTGLLYSTVVAISATWSFTPRAYFILPSLFLAGTVLFHFLKKYKVRLEFLLMLLVSIITTAVLKFFILLS
jgi:hypothetical protein